MATVLKMPKKKEVNQSQVDPPENEEASQAAGMLDGDSQEQGEEGEVTEEAVAAAPTADPLSEDGTSREGEVIEPELTEAEQIEKAKELFERKLHNSEQYYIELSSERLVLNEKLKRLKKAEQAALKQVHDIKEGGWQGMMERVKPAKANLHLADDPAETTEQNAISDTQPLAEQLDGWKSVSIDELGLQGKFMEKLKDANVDTMGKLAQHVEDVSLSRAVWPKGIGEAKITKIEDALNDWLRANRDSGLFGQGGEVAVATDVDMGEGKDDETPQMDDVDPDEAEAALEAAEAEHEEENDIEVDSDEADSQMVDVDDL